MVVKRTNMFYHFISAIRKYLCNISISNKHKCQNIFALDIFKISIFTLKKVKSYIGNFIANMDFMFFF